MREKMLASALFNFIIYYLLFIIYYLLFIIADLFSLKSDFLLENVNIVWVIIVVVAYVVLTPILIVVVAGTIVAFGCLETLGVFGIGVDCLRRIYAIIIAPGRCRCLRRFVHRMAPQRGNTGAGAGAADCSGCCCPPIECGIRPIVHLRDHRSKRDRLRFQFQDSVELAKCHLRLLSTAGVQFHNALLNPHFGSGHRIFVFQQKPVARVIVHKARLARRVHNPFLDIVDALRVIPFHMNECLVVEVPIITLLAYEIDPLDETQFVLSKDLGNDSFLCPPWRDARDIHGKLVVEHVCVVVCVVESIHLDLLLCLVADEI